MNQHAVTEALVALLAASIVGIPSWMAFRRIRSPARALALVPLVGALLVAGTPLAFFGFIGAVALFGVLQTQWRPALAAIVLISVVTELVAAIRHERMKGAIAVPRLLLAAAIDAFTTVIAAGVSLVSLPQLGCTAVLVLAGGFGVGAIFGWTFASVSFLVLATVVGVVVLGGRVLRRLVVGSPLTVGRSLVLPAVVLVPVVLLTMLGALALQRGVNHLNEPTASSVRQGPPDRTHPDTRCASQVDARGRALAKAVPLQPAHRDLPAALTGVAWESTMPFVTGTPIPAGDIVLETSQDAGQDKVVALDATTGRPLWNAAAPATTTTASAVRAGNWVYFTDFGRLMRADARTGAGLLDTRLYVRAPFTIAGGRIFESSIAHLASASDLATGRLLWETGPQGNPRVQPLLIDGHAIFLFDQLSSDQPSPLMAADASTGSQTWKIDLVGGEGTPDVVAGDHDVFAVDGTSVVRAIDARTGQVRWKFSTRAPDNGLIAAGNGMVIVLDSDNILSGIDARSGHEVWCRGMSGGGRPTLVDGVVYIQTSIAVEAFDAKTGARRGQMVLGGVANPIGGPGVVYVASGGQVSAFR